MLALRKQFKLTIFMPRVFVGNFDFEHELASGQRELTRAARQHAADLATVWMACATSEDVIWTPPEPQISQSGKWTEFEASARLVSRESELPRGPGWELVPWGWTARLLDWGTRFGWTCPAPAIEVVRRVNSRLFRWQLESELEVALPGSAVFRNVDEAVAHFAESGSAFSGWVLKANFGMSGRERIVGRGADLPEPVRNWIDKRCRQSDAVVFEPWLDRVEEAGIQWSIPRSGEPQLLGITALLTDHTGTYRGSRICGPENELARWQDAVDVTRTVARQLQAAGYWGPLGVDAMHHRTARGEIVCRPLQDLNARYTMGRLALGLQRFVPEGQTADWLHDAALVEAAIAQDPGAQVIQTTPRSWLVIGTAKG